MVVQVSCTKDVRELFDNAFAAYRASRVGIKTRSDFLIELLQHWRTSPPRTAQSFQ